MNEEQLFKQMKMWRNWTVEFLRTIPENIVDQIPIGHKNTIRWNAGHLLVGWDHTVFPAVTQERHLPLSYHVMFLVAVIRITGLSNRQQWIKSLSS